MGSGRASGYLVSGIALMLVAGCVQARQLAANTPSAVVPSATFTPIPTLTPGLTSTVPAFPTVTPAPQVTSTTFYALISADNVNLRTGPGTVFPVSRLLANGTRLEVLGHAPGGEWLYVRTDSNINGWVLYWLVKGGLEGETTPLVEPEAVRVIQGVVVDRAGVSISGIGFAVTNGAGAKAARTDATSDGTGHFYAFLPASASGTWIVSYVSVACTSNTMDASCSCIGTCGRPEPNTINITLPLDSALQFVWK